MKRYLCFFLILFLFSTIIHSAEESTAEISQTTERQFSSLAFSNASNTKNDEDDINVTIKTQERIGSILNDALPVFGKNLFNNQCKQLHQTNFFNSHYRITVGDKINLQMWGAYQFNQELVVDTQGNIFIPEVGPVRLEGVENKRLNQLIANHITKIFSKDVHVYADLVTVQPVQVYVAGYVNEPGLYDGLSSDSVIYFLCKAGGINLKEGSFRAIDIVRQNKPIRRIDLYDFILSGNIQHFQLHPGDTIVVRPQEYTISVDGKVKNAYQYEWLSPQISMKEIMRVANIDPSVTFVRIQKNQGNKPKVLYLHVSEASTMVLHNNDKVTFVADHEVSQVLVTVKGQIQGKHQYVIKRGVNLSEFLHTLHFTRQANIRNTQLYRESVAVQQKLAINASLARLHRQVMTATSTTEAGAKIQEAQATTMLKFIADAKQVDPKGQIVLGEPCLWKNVILENNDVINIPQRTSVITISGDVVNAISLECRPNYTILDYIMAAGGVEKTANVKELLVIKQNGKVNVVQRTHWHSRHVPIEGGDQIIVLPKVNSENWQITEAVSRILFQIAIAAKVALVAI
jgi:protein involved in polysaccharide export with SLBB domain